MRFGSNQNEGFKFEDSNSNMLLQLDGGNNTSGNGALSATFAGAITASGGNSTQWNAAYGWGNHASGGYAADSAVVKLTGAQSISGNKSFTSLSNYYSGHLYYTPYNAGGAHYPHFLDGSNGTGVAINWRIYTGASTLLTHVWDTTKARFVTRIESSIDMRTPIFYDIDNTAYYVNPASTSNVNAITWSGGSSANANTAYGWGNHASAGYLTSVPNHSAATITSGNLAAARNTANLVDVGSSSDAQGIYFRGTTEVISGEGWCTAQYAYNYNDGFLFLNRNAQNTAFPTFHIGGWNNAGHAGYTDADGMITLTRSDGTKTAASANAGTGLSNTSYWTRMVKTAYKTIFKDAQDEHLFDGNVAIGIQTSGISTPEYGNLRVSNNGNGETTMGNGSIALQLGPATQRAGTSKPYYGGIAFNGLLNYNNSNTYDSAPHVWVGAKYHDTPGSERSYFAVGVKSGVGLTSTDVPIERFTIDYSGNAIVSGSSRAPVFYDSDNTAYYVNPASDSNLNGLLVGGNRIFAEGLSPGSWYGDLGSNGYTREAGLGMTGGSEFVVLSKNGQGSTLVDGAYLAYESANGFFGSFNSTYGNLTGIQATAANTLTVKQLDGGAAILSVTQDVRAPIFYDSANTAQFIDPGGSTSRMLGFLKIGNSSTYNTDDGSWGARLQVASTVHARIDVAQDADAMRSTWYCHVGGGGSLFGTLTSHHQYFYSHNAKRQTLFNGYSQEEASYRAPIFYDSNDTGYYIDPNGVSRMSSIMTGKGSSDSNGTASISLNDGQLLFRTSTDFNHKMWYYDGLNFSTNPSHGHIRFWADSSSRTNGSGGSTIVLDSDCQNIVTKIYGSTQSPIYYDLNNTAYYVDPHSTSVIVGLTMAGALQTAGSHTVGSSGTANIYMGGVSGNYFRFHTNNSHTYFDANVGDIHWRQGSSTRFTFYMTSANMTINGSLTQNSDERVKENIVEIPNAIDKVKAMKGVYYNRTDFNTGVTKVGVLAQEVEAVLPELIVEAPDSGLKSVAYGELTAVLINAVKELEARVQELENN
jgi:hypothetical protein